MSDGIIPPGEKLRRAVKWISDERRADPDRKLAPLVDEAALRFDLSPADQDWLTRALREGSDEAKV